MRRIREFLLEWWEVSWKTVLVGAGAMVLVALPYLLGGGTIVEVKGTVIAPFAMPSDDHDAFYMRVSLESGQEVRVSIPRTLPVVSGKQVVLTSRRSRIGFPSYGFSRYVDERF